MGGPAPDVTLRLDIATVRHALEDDRIHPGSSDTTFDVPGCEACEALAALDRLVIMLDQGDAE